MKLLRARLFKPKYYLSSARIERFNGTTVTYKVYSLLAYKIDF